MTSIFQSTSTFVIEKFMFVVEKMSNHLENIDNMMREGLQRRGKLGSYNEKKILEELKRSGTLEKRDIMSILKVSKNSALDIMKRIESDNVVYISGIGSKKSKIVWVENDEVTKRAKKLFKVLEKGKIYDRKNVMEALNITTKEELDQVIKRCSLLRDGEIKYTGYGKKVVRKKRR